MEWPQSSPETLKSVDVLIIVTILNFLKKTLT